MVVSNKLVVAFAIVYFVDISVVNGFVIDRGNVKNNDTGGIGYCESEIYCHGDLLHTIQMAKLYDDSKTFVDMKLKQKPEITLDLFKEFMAKYDNNPTQADIRQFVNDNFEKPGAEFTDWDPQDWHPSPKFLENIKDADYKQWATDLHNFWKKLGRQMIEDVGENPELYSIIHVKNPVIVPGGRFREFYYWDSYWIIRGLLYSEMYKTAKGMLENFLSIIDRFGFIPNGGRLYYSERSQPPLLTGMIKSYVDATNDVAFMSSSVPILERELYFFLNNHMVNVKGHALAIYGDKSSGPRPESYYEDYELAKNLQTEEEREDLYSELKAGAESGMDFTSRWFIKNGTNEGGLADIKCRSIVPVELNAILFWNSKILAEFYMKANNPKKAAEFETKAQELYEAVQAVLWNEEVGTWLDYDLINEKPRNYFVPTNLSPLWVGCYNTNDTANIANKTLEYVKKTGIDLFPGGVPNTLMQSGEQWDYPNVWPPMQYILVESLRALGDKRTDQVAMSWISRWVQSNFMAYKDTRAMYEKYSAEELGGHGGGGEYDVQLGFGWSNGVILEWLAEHGNNLSSTGVSKTTSTPGSARNLNGWTIGATTAIAATVVSIAALMFG